MNSRKFKNAIKNLVCYLPNILTIKKKRSFYARLTQNTLVNDNDILNCSSSNLLYFLNSFIQIPHDKKIHVYVEYYYKDREKEYAEFAQQVKNNNVKLKFVRTHRSFKNPIKRMLKRVRNAIIRFSTKFWLSETGDCNFGGKLHCQKIICFNYFISCKNDLIEGDNFRWSYLDYLVTSSLLHSQVISSSTGVKLDHCLTVGFSRNDVLIKQPNREKVENWIKEEVGHLPKHIFVYAPTYRDTETKQANAASRNLLGYPTEWLADFLKRTDSVFIYRLHSLQEKSILITSKEQIKFKVCFDFSFYDLVAMADCLITDYSSIGYDFLLVDKPLIYNLYDLDKYIETRGVSYDPYVDFCPGEIVQNDEQLLGAMEDVVNGNDKYKGKRSDLTRLLHKNADDNSTDRTIRKVEQIMNKHGK